VAPFPVGGVSTMVFDRKNSHHVNDNAKEDGIWKSLDRRASHIIFDYLKPFRILLDVLGCFVDCIEKLSA
jgi:hypothetical protein